MPAVAGATNVWRDRIFLPKHVAPTAEAAELPLRTDADPDRCAALLSGAFERAMMWAALDRSGAAPAELRKWHGRVAGAAANLLAILGQDPDAMAKGEIIATEIQSHPATRHLWSMATGMEARDPPVPPVMERWLHCSIEFEKLSLQRRQAAEEKNPDGSPTNHNLNARTLTAADAATEMLPEALGIVLAIARVGSVAPDGKRRGGGRPEDVFRRELFVGLADAAREMFGGQPRARDKAGNPDPYALAWVRQLLQIASDRIRTAFGGNPEVTLAQLDTLRNAEDATLAKHIEAGQRAWRRARRPAAR